MERHKLLVGIDIGSEIVQIAYYDDTQFEPVCIDAGIAVTNDVQIIEDCIDALEKEFGDFGIDKLTVCMEDYNRARSGNIKELLVCHGIDGDNVYIQNYKMSYLYYVLNQSKEFWVNDVGLFDYGKNGLVYRQLAVDRRHSPYVVGILEKDYSSMMMYEDSGDNSRGYILENIAENAIHRQIISTIYVTGIGFDGDWADESLKKLCMGRRVFKGQNLYVRGACYASKKHAGLSKMPEFIYIDEEMIPVHVSTSVYVNASRQELVIAKAGTPWYNIDTSIYVIPDGENELQLNVTNVITRDKSKHLISLGFLNPDSLEMKARLRVRIRFQDINKCIVTVYDEGFGEICKSSRRVCERIIDTSE